MITCLTSAARGPTFHPVTTTGELRGTAPISAGDPESQSRSAILPFTRSAADGGTGGVPCAAIGDVPIALDTVRWQMGQARRLAIVMKADFRLDPIEGKSRPAPWPPRFNPVDVRSGKRRGAHVSAASCTAIPSTDFCCSRTPNAKGAIAYPTITATGG